MQNERLDGQWFVRDDADWLNPTIRRNIEIKAEQIDWRFGAWGDITKGDSPKDYSRCRLEDAAWKALRKYEAGKGCNETSWVDRWLKFEMRHIERDLARHAKKGPKFVSADADCSDGDDGQPCRMIDTLPDPTDRHSACVYSDDLRQALEELERRSRLLADIVRTYAVGNSLNETARLLHIPTSTLYAKLWPRAMKILRNALER